MVDILKIAEQLNQEATKFNNERIKLEGMLESSKVSYDKAVKAYELKYGVKLTEENLQSEYNEVFARTKGSVLDLQEKVESIKRGDYKKEDTGVSFDFEPDVEPIRATQEIVEDTVEENTVVDETKVEEEVKAEPEKKKRGRKPKAAVVAEEPEIITPAKKEEEPVIPEGPLNLNLDFSSMGEETVVSSPVKEEPKKVEKKNIVDDLDALLAEADTVVQNPITALGVEEEEDDDEVSLDELGIDAPFGTNPDDVSGDSDDEVSFGDFGGFGGFGDIESGEETKVEPKKEETTEGGFGDFAGFGDFSGFGGLEEPEEIKPVAKKEEKKEETPITPEGWGEEVGFNFGGFDDILNSSDIKFGE